MSNQVNLRVFCARTQIPASLSPSKSFIARLLPGFSAGAKRTGLLLPAGAIHKGEQGETDHCNDQTVQA
jgi:hypothetical protein